MLTIDDRIAGFRAFWARAEVERPLVILQVRATYPGEAMVGLPKDRSLRPDDVEPNKFLAWYEQQHEANAVLPGPLLWSAAPLWNFPWLEAIAGCTIGTTGDTFWAEPASVDPGAGFFSADPRGNPWLAKLLEFHRALVVHSGGRFPVGLPLMRGPADLAAALRGSQRLALDLYDDRGMVASLLARCADLWVAVAQAQVDSIPPWRGGYGLPLRSLWAPGPAAQTQDDAAFLFSPSLYRDLVLAHDRRTAACLPYAYSTCTVVRRTSWVTCWCCPSHAVLI